MKKGLSIFLTIVWILMIIGGVELMIFSVLYQAPATEVREVAHVDTGNISEYTPLYIENLEVIERYAFQTVDEYRDSEGTYIDTTYYVYKADHPMDDHELFREYYIVRFTDASGKGYLTSLTVTPDQDIARELKGSPMTISACVGASPATGSSFANSNDQKLSQLRDAALSEYTLANDLDCANFTLEYQARTLEQYQSQAETDATSAKVISLIFGLVLIVGGILLMLHIRKKKKATRP